MKSMKLLFLTVWKYKEDSSELYQISSKKWHAGNFLHAIFFEL